MRISDWSSDVCSSDLLPMGRIWRGLLFTAALFRNDARIAFHRHGQAHDEAGAALRVLAVGDADLALVPLHDGAGDGEAQAAMLAERLAFRADAVEAAEDMFAFGLRDAGAFVLHADQNFIVRTRPDVLDPSTETRSVG